MEPSKHGLRRRGRIWKKLHTSRGASMIFALAVFMLCILTGTAALTAASGNMGRYTHLEGEQQQYLSVASALELMSGQMEPVAVKVQYVVKEEWEYVAGADPTCNYTYELKLVDPAVLPASLNFYQKMLLMNCVPDEWYTNTSGVPGALEKPNVTTLAAGSKTYTIRLSEDNKDEPWADTLYPVKAKVNYGVEDAVTGALVQNDYTLEMHLYADLSNPAVPAVDTEKPYPIRVVWPGAVSTDSVEDVKTEGDLTGVFSRNPGAKGTRTTTTTLTCTLEWPAENRVITFE